MQPSLKTGVERSERVSVDRQRAIDFLGEANRVYSTPAMVSDIEYACYRLIEAHLEPGESSLGVHVSVDHLGPTPLGAEVTVRVRVSAIDGRKVTLDAEVSDDVEIVGRGRHVRYIIDLARHEKRLKAKIETLDRGS
ncbi:MAG: LysR family transcriptional regulator [Gammaproteobacteria bacterium]|nr:LysR family transcriptional regulator [Gammaproteobacteria bacterium]MDH3410893.1 LysR family transcriptional regulator [Gammaproteobacteria bacterium]